MHVFLETNFVLELALRQQEYNYCERIRQQARSTPPPYTLYVPHYALSEAFQRLRPLKSERAQYEQYVLTQIEQHLREDDSDADAMDAFKRTLTTLLAERTRTQTQRLYSIVAELIEEAPGPALTPTSVAEAQELAERHGLQVQDALIYACVLAAMRELPADAPKLFVSRNRQDFSKSSILEELNRLNSDYVATFQAAAGKLRV
ncbi:hypothetical protein GCM10011375_39210 [Hymenobacter qilianensis]|uniref:Uncharacterized protein n=2 Tax=Hymenobacter qilianensis TaxID=1385715 RepID=A0ACB5PX12_9BACT|nr:hypothetical protein [Hymenobacter qilianensis]QNP54403.1 hypothetical protein H9L05_21740 [Hymenobacter qilianensis]GGF80271.1 hypothetical protein GCM10011375_39210 [Hymenobacter qilianensis]